MICSFGKLLVNLHLVPPEHVDQAGQALLLALARVRIGRGKLGRGLEPGVQAAALVERRFDLGLMFFIGQHVLEDFFPRHEQRLIHAVLIPAVFGAGQGAVNGGLGFFEQFEHIVPYVLRRFAAVGHRRFHNRRGFGSGGFPGSLSAGFRRRGGDGGEYGATTGRPRRVGWYDCVASKYGCRLQGATDVAFTVLDVLGYLDAIPVCVAYEIDGATTTEFPVTHLLAKARPVWKKLPGWKCDIRGIRKYEDLPENCRNYIEFIEQQIGYPITMVSNGPGREDIIYR